MTGVLSQTYDSTNNSVGKIKDKEIIILVFKVQFFFIVINLWEKW